MSYIKYILTFYSDDQSRYGFRTLKDAQSIKPSNKTKKPLSVDGIGVGERVYAKRFTWAKDKYLTHHSISSD
ncbi:hypothetical protein A3194_07085 [Candidatus Thiodiazotropha endoloripes]|nr:hypothetical protein A3194_07085 [Candidatus Thiodiazotropha endoloripes]